MSKYPTRMLTNSNWMEAVSAITLDRKWVGHAGKTRSDRSLELYARAGREKAVIRSYHREFGKEQSVNSETAVNKYVNSENTSWIRMDIRRFAWGYHALPPKCTSPWLSRVSVYTFYSTRKMLNTWFLPGWLEGFDRKWKGRYLLRWLPWRTFGEVWKRSWNILLIILYRDY